MESICYQLIPSGRFVTKSEALYIMRNDSRARKKRWTTFSTNTTSSENKSHNKTSHYNPLPAVSQNFTGNYNPQPESKPRFR